MSSIWLRTAGREEVNTVLDVAGAAMAIFVTQWFPCLCDTLLGSKC